MIQMQTSLEVADNSGARRVELIMGIGGATGAIASLGDRIKVTEKEASPDGAIKKGTVQDAVIVSTRKEVRRRGRVLAVAQIRGKVKIEGAGIIKRHQKPAGNRSGGIIDKESWVDISNVQIVDPQSGKPSRVGYKTDADGTKFRVATASGHSI